MKAPNEIWVNIYNELKPNSWDIHATEASAVVNSIGAPTHKYLHETIPNPIINVQVLESHDSNDVEWGVSFTDHNPLPEDFFPMSKETAFRLKDYLTSAIKLKHFK